MADSDKRDVCSCLCALGCTSLPETGFGSLLACEMFGEFGGVGKRTQSYTTKFLVFARANDSNFSLRQLVILGLLATPHGDYFKRTLGCASVRE